MSFRILIVHNYYQIPGGEDTVVENERKMLEAQGHFVRMYTRHNDELKTFGIFRKMLLPISTLFNLRTFREIKQVIQSEQINIVHVHNTLNLISPAVYYAALSCKIPVIQTVHNFRLLCPGATFYRDGHICEDCVENGLYCAIKHGCYRGSRLQTLVCVLSTSLHRLTGIYKKIVYICLTEFNKEKLLQLKHISPERIFVKPNFVNIEQPFIPAKERENYYVFAGRLDKLKGVDLLLEAWRQMGKMAPELLICGTGPLMEWCDSFISKNDLTMVKCLGYKRNRDIREILSKSKAMILPTQWYEGFPMSIAEAFSVGTPVICSDLGNAGNLIIEGVTGFKFKNLQELEDCLKKIEHDTDIYHEVIGYYLNNYTEEKNATQLVAIYEFAEKLHFMNFWLFMNLEGTK